MAKEAAKALRDGTYISKVIQFYLAIKSNHEPRFKSRRCFILKTCLATWGTIHISGVKI